MEGSGKWPHDRLAIRHIKAAFHIRLGDLLKKQHNYTCKACATHLDVWKVRARHSVSVSYLYKGKIDSSLLPPPLPPCCVQDGLVFRIQVAYHREPQVLRESVNAEGMLIVRDNEEAQALEMSTVHKPLLTSMLHG